MANIDWGDAPTWIAGVFAGAAAIYARGMLRSQQKQIAEQRVFIAEQSANLAMEREALVAAADHRREEQARLVRVAEEAVYDAAVRNASLNQVSNVSCTVGGELSLVAHVVKARDFAENPRMELSRAVAVECPIPSLPPGHVAVFASRDDGQPFVLQFTDDSGLRWELDQDNVLRSLSSE